MDVVMAGFEDAWEDFINNPLSLLGTADDYELGEFIRDIESEIFWEFDLWPGCDEPGCFDIVVFNAAKAVDEEVINNPEGDCAKRLAQRILESEDYIYDKIRTSYLIDEIDYKLQLSGGI